MEEETHKTIYSFKWGWLDKYFKHDKRILNAVLRRATSEIHKQLYGDHCGNYFSNDVYNEFIRSVENDPTYLLENRLDFSSREYSPITEVPFFCSDGRVKNHDHYERELGILSKKMNKGIIQKYEYLHVSGKIRGVNAYHFSVIEQYKKQIRKEKKRINKLEALSKKENRMNELVVIKKTVIGTEEVNSVDARELHTFLESKQEFAHWIDTKVVSNPFFVNNVDFIVLDNIIKNPKGGRPRVDYALTIDTAKKVAMAEQTSRGNEVREYFIQCEKKLKNQDMNLTPAEMFLRNAQMMVEQEKKMVQIEQEQVKQADKLLELESRVRTSDFDYYTVSGYANLRGFKNIDLNKANLIGRMASKLSRDYGMDIGQAKDVRFGSVGTYHLDILVEVFRQHGFN